jgi:hypothetical protein
MLQSSALLVRLCWCWCKQTYHTDSYIKYKYGAYNYVQYIILDSKWLYYWFVIPYTIVLDFTPPTYEVYWKTVYHVMLAAALGISFSMDLLISPRSHNEWWTCTIHTCSRTLCDVLKTKSTNNTFLKMNPHPYAMHDRIIDCSMHEKMGWMYYIHTTRLFNLITLNTREDMDQWTLPPPLTGNINW